MGNPPAKEFSSAVRKILLLYPFYWPHYKAGGPVQSLFNLAGYFKDEASFYVISKDSDIDGSKSDEPIINSRWITGPQNEQIHYTSAITTSLLFRLIRTIRPNVILINGMFNLNTTLNGIIVSKLLGIKMIISPRGMLQAWGLQRNSFVKRIYLAKLRLILGRRELWHATDEKEANDIHTHFGSQQNVNVASNIPRSISKPLEVAWIGKNEKIKIVFLSLINPNKNLHLIIEVVNALKDFFSLAIYGPVIDSEYWMKCKSLISQESDIQYKGPVPPWEVPTILGQFHFFILPTQGENFGHAIFDALSCGTPVITSKNTPWADIDQAGAGFYIDPLNPDGMKLILEKVRLLTAGDYQSLKSGSIQYARRYQESRDYKSEYKFLFE